MAERKGRVELGKEKSYGGRKEGRKKRKERKNGRNLVIQGSHMVSDTLLG